MKAAVLGSPIDHSKSPLLHSAAYAALGLSWTYERHDIGLGGLADFLRANAGVYKGLSLTMPLKHEAFVAAETKDVASYATAACNTLVFDGQLHGYNTDVIGFVEALRYHKVPRAGSVCIIGTGATARSAAVAMQQDGVEELHVVGRRAGALDDFRIWFGGLGGSVTTHSWDATPLDVDLTISTTTTGATDDRPLPKRPQTLFDVIYAPWPTAYAARWSAAGCPVLSGMDLLVHQAAEQVLLMTGTGGHERPRVVEAMYAAARG